MASTKTGSSSELVGGGGPAPKLGEGPGSKKSNLYHVLTSCRKYYTICHIYISNIYIYIYSILHIVYYTVYVIHQIRYRDLHLELGGPSFLLALTPALPKVDMPRSPPQKVSTDLKKGMAGVHRAPRFTAKT